MAEEDQEEVVVEVVAVGVAMGEEDMDVDNNFMLQVPKGHGWLRT